MDNNLQSKMAADIAPFRLPRYAQIPDIGLYLEQVRPKKRSTRPSSSHG